MPLSPPGGTGEPRDSIGSERRKRHMGWLGSIFKTGSYLGSVGSAALEKLGNIQDNVKHAIHTVADYGNATADVINSNADKLDSVGLGHAARYIGHAMASGSDLGRSVGNLVGSKNLDDAIGNSVDAYKKGLSFAGDVMNYKSVIPSSPIQR